MRSSVLLPAPLGPSTRPVLAGPDRDADPAEQLPAVPDQVDVTGGQDDAGIGAVHG